MTAAGGRRRRWTSSSEAATAIDAGDGAALRGSCFFARFWLLGEVGFMDLMLWLKV